MVVDIQEEVGPARVGERIYNSDLYVGVHWMLRIRPATFSLCSMQHAITSPNPNGSIGTPFVVQHIFFARCLCQTPPLMTPFAHPLWLQCLAANSSPLCFICTSLVAAGGSLFSMRGANSALHDLFVATAMVANAPLCTMHEADSCQLCLSGASPVAATCPLPLCTMCATISALHG